MKKIKKLSALFLIALLTMALIPTMASAEVIDGINGTFLTDEEGNLPVWGYRIEAKQFADGEDLPYEGYVGNYGAVTSSSVSSGPEFAVEPGQSIYVSGYFKGNGGLTIYLTYYNEQDEYISETKPNIYPGETWAPFVQSFVAPANTAKVYVRFRNNSGGDKCQNIADIKIQVKEPTMLPDITTWGGLTSGLTKENLPSGGKDGATAISIPTNQLAWKRIGVHQFSADSDPKWEPNVAYTLTLFYKTDVALDGEKIYAPTIRIIYNGSNLDYPAYNTGHKVNEWNEARVNFLLPADMNLATSKIEILTGDITPTAGTLYISDVRLAKDKASTTLWNGSAELANNQIVANSTVTVKHHLVGDVNKIAAQGSAQAKANVIVALYKVEGNSRKIVNMKITATDMWTYQKTLAKGVDIEIPFEIGNLETGNYELKVIDLDLAGTMKTLSKVAKHTATYTAQ